MVDIAIILLLLVVNGLFSMYEMALVSSSKVRLETMAAAGNKNARRVLGQIAQPEKILSTIQVVITLIGIVSGAFGGVALTDDFRPIVEAIPALEPYATLISMIVVVGGITYLSLIVGELVPKSVALSNPERIAVSFSRLIVLTTRVVYPFVLLLSASVKLVNRIFGVKMSDRNSAMNEDELKFILHQSSTQGVIDPREGRMLKEVFRFGDKKACEIMTHRKDIVAFDVSNSRQQVLQTIAEARLSKYPLCDGSVDKIEGVVSVKDIVLMDDAAFDLCKIADKPICVPENMLASRILDLFKDQKSKLAVVVSEYGSVEGLVTLHDLSEAIFGEILGTGQVAQPSITKRNENSWFVDGAMSIDDFMDQMGIVIYDDIDDLGFNTMAGMAIAILGRVATEGDMFEYRNLRFEVVDMDASRVDKLIVTRI